MLNNENPAADLWQADYDGTYLRLRNSGEPHLTATIMASNEVTRRRGPQPTLVKAYQDQGGPIGGAL